MTQSHLRRKELISASSFQSVLKEPQDRNSRAGKSRDHVGSAVYYIAFLYQEDHLLSAGTMVG